MQGTLGQRPRSALALQFKLHRVIVEGWLPAGLVLPGTISPILPRMLVICSSVLWMAPSENSTRRHRLSTNDQHWIKE
jgi:hypothetical protein